MKKPDYLVQRHHVSDQRKLPHTLYGPSHLSYDGSTTLCGQAIDRKFVTTARCGKYIQQEVSCVKCLIDLGLRVLL